MMKARTSIVVLATLASGFARSQETFTPVNVTFAGWVSFRLPLADNGESRHPCISGDGRHVAFESDSTDLISSDANGRQDVFVRDLVNHTANHTTELVSVNTSEQTGNGDSSTVGEVGRNALGSDRRFVLFRSEATDLVVGDTNGIADLFVRDRVASTTERVSVTDAEGQLSRASRVAQMSADGNRILFRSNALELGATPHLE